MAFCPHGAFEGEIGMAAVWNPETYLNFAGERLRAAVDLLQRIPLGRCERVYDLGCGPGNVTNLLQQRWPEAKISGLDSSPEMLASARASFPSIEWVQGDIADWKASAPPDVIFSNAALHWVPNHAELMPALLHQLRSGGCLAVQMPHHVDSPGHLLILEIARDPRWAARLVPLASQIKVHSPEDYWRWLRPHAAGLDIWETIYVHELEGDRPVVEFFRGSQLRAYLHALNPDEQKDFLDAYAEKTAKAFPRQPNGKTLFPFRRLFFVASR
jgi:trans-aconitate 2-methyltransferase